MRSFIRGLWCFLTVITSLVFIAIIEIDNTIPTNFYTKTSENFNLNLDNISASINLKDNSLNVDEQVNNILNYRLKLFNLIPIKNINVKTSDDIYVTPSGTAFGIKIITDGVLVVGESDIYTKNGPKRPFKEANIKTGDILISINGNYIYSNDDIKNIVSNSKGEVLNIKFISDGVEKESNIKPELSTDDNTYKIGIWVRDSSAGIGTMTFTTKDKKVFAGLGHGVSDVDTNQLLPVRKGEIVGVNITNIDKSENGIPGQLRGVFNNTESIGQIFTNSVIGIYGKLNSNFIDNNKEEIPIKFKQEIKKGDAKIITTIDDKGPKVYDIKIDKIDYNKNKLDRNMVVEIVDEELLNKSGGIVQGMSGSPIIQDGKVIGALTHVFVNDIKKGYAIFAENMVNMANTIN